METNGPEGEGVEKLSSDKTGENEGAGKKAADEVNLSSLEGLEMGPNWTAPGYKARRTSERSADIGRSGSRPSRVPSHRERGDGKRPQERREDPLLYG